MAGRLYATSTGTSTGTTYKKAYTEVYTANTGLREPDIVINYDTTTDSTDSSKYLYLPTLTSILGDGYDTPENFKNMLQTEYNEIVALVYNSGGYYVGRYETSNIKTTANTAIKVVAGTTAGMRGMDWYYMYAQQKAYATNKNLGNKVKSSMILGTCYDQMLEFVNVKGKYNVAIPGNAEHNSMRYKTGSQSTDMSKNIYDLEGNVCEWTTEANRIYDRVNRGGDCVYNYSASVRSAVNPSCKSFNRRSTVPEPHFL